MEMRVIGEWSVRSMSTPDKIEQKGCIIGPAKLTWRCMLFGHHFEAKHSMGICHYLGYAARLCLRCAMLHPKDKVFCESLKDEEDACE